MDLQRAGLGIFDFIPHSFPPALPYMYILSLRYGGFRIRLSNFSSCHISIQSTNSVVYSYAADYTVYQPANVSRTKTFFWTWIGLIFPL